MNLRETSNLQGGLDKGRGGDPLSHYLFVLCSKGINWMLQKAAREDSIRGFSLCKSGLEVSHLIFANDSLLIL